MKRYLSYLLSLIVTVNVLGQSNPVPANLQRVIPPTPEAASFGKYGDIPVSYYTGVPSISIPIHEIKLKDFRLPVSIDYHAAGIKVNDISSNVGIGWSLSASGSISVTVNGLPDIISGQINTNKDIIDRYKSTGLLSQTTTDDDWIHKNDIYNGLKEVSPDIFSFSFPGQNGKFSFDENKEPRHIPFSKLKVSWKNNGFIIIDTKGVIYEFYSEESSSVSNSCNSTTFGAVSYSPTWFISKIILPTGETINYKYSNITYSYKLPNAEYKYYPTVGGICNSAQPQDIVCESTQLVNGKRLDSIISSDGTMISFNYNSVQRKDLPGSYSLKEIKVLKSGEVLSSWDLYSSYFETANPNNIAENYSLRLDSIKKSIEPSYVFTYDQTFSNPARNSYSQDHWGYFNSSTNSTLIPPQNIQGWPTAGANREINESAAQNRILKKVKYPTGGNTEFYYESNSYFFSDSEPSFQFNSSSVLSINGTIETKQTTFTTASAGTIYGRINFQTNATNMPPGDFCKGTLVGPGVSEYFENLSSIKNVYLLPNSTYTITLQTTTDYFSYNGGYVALTGSIYVDISTQTSNQVTENRKAGGLRIKKIVNNTGNQVANVARYSYVLPESSNNYSSGYLALPLNYKILSKGFASAGGGAPIECTYVEARSVSNYDLSPIKGSAVGYIAVSVTEDSLNSNGKKVYHYNKVADQPGDFSVGIPAVSNDWERGFLTKEEFFRKSSSGFTLIKSVDYKYKVNYAPILSPNYVETQPNCTNIWNIHIELEQPSGTFGGSTPALYKAHAYYTRSVWVYNDSVITKEFDDAGNTLQTASVNYYDNTNNPNPTRIETTDSKGFVTKVLTYSPLDKSSIHAITALSTEAATALDTMVARNIISPVIQQVQYNNNNLTQLSLTNYKLWSNNIVLPANVKQQVKNNTIDTRLEFISYDNSGNLLEQKKSSDGSHSYIWGYSNQYPTAQAINASNTDIAYSSFESDEKGNWSYSGLPILAISLPTGIKYYNVVSGNITKSGLQSGTTYIITYWRKDGTGTVTVNSVSGTSLSSRNGWTLYKHELTGVTSVTVSGSGDIDELRLHPKDAQMDTYTYKPLVGILSQTDANNRTLYYEYDDLNRLNVVRDQDGKILKKYCYNYAGRQEECGTFYNIVKTGNFTKNNCSSGTGSTVTYTVPANLYSASTQQAANDLAQADVNANGQAYANQYGTCLYSSVNYSGTYYSAVCSNGATPQPIYVSVPSGMFTSTISQTDANTQAYSYAQNYANTYGTCSSGVEVNAWNDIGDYVYVELQNTSTNQFYYLQASAFQYGAIGTIPAGNYNVTVTVGSYGFYSFSVGCYNYSSGSSATFYNIAISSSCNTISIY